MTKNCCCVTSYLRSHAYDSDFWYTYVKWYLQQFFSFFLNFDVLVFSPLKTPKIKILKKWKNLLEIPLFYICVPKIRMISCMAPEIRSDTATKGQKMVWNYQFQSVTLCISGTLDHVIEILLHRCKIMISPGVVLYFFKKCSIVNIKIILFLSALLNSFF